jgi:G3E family GTPase
VILLNKIDLVTEAELAVLEERIRSMNAIAAEDGWVCLWQKATQAAQILEGAKDGFSTLAWSPQGKYLAAGGCG